MRIHADTAVEQVIHRADLLIKKADYPGALRALRGVSFKHLPSQYRSLLKLLQGMELSGSGQFSRAIQEFLEAAVGFQSLGDVREAAAIDAMAYAQSQMGEFNAAERNYLKAIGVYRTAGDREREARVAHNLAYFYLEKGSLEMALDTYAGYPLSRADVGAPIFNNYCLNLSIGYLMQGRIYSAGQTLTECVPNVEGDTREQCLYNRIGGQISLATGHTEKAIKLLQLACHISEHISGSRDLLPGCYRWLAEALVQQAIEIPAANDRWLQDARTSALTGLRVAITQADRWEIGAGKRVLAVIASRRGEIRTGKRLFEEALSLFKRRGFRYELAMTQFAAARSGLFSNVVADAMLIQAEQYCAQEDVQFVRSRIHRMTCLLREIAESPAGLKDVGLSTLNC
jgi:tetratricopeptide (TPR) repeat protein